ncbi:MAG: serine hydrolase [Bacteroidota bacterium]
MKFSCFFLALSVSVGFISAQGLYFPPDHDVGAWETIAPEDFNYRADRIQALYDFLADNETKSFMLLKDGKIILEQYFGNYTADSIWVWNSAGKSLRATMFGQAVEEGWLSLDDVSSDYLGTGWSSLTPDQESAISVRNHLTMTTGMDDSLDDCLEPACFEYLVPPGERWFYDNPPYTISKDILEAAVGTTINAYTNTRIEQPLGMSNGFWFPFGINTIYLSRARDMARFGLMIQADGSWNSEQIVDSAYVHLMTQPSQDMNPAYGILWWLNGQESYIPPGVAFSLPGPISTEAPQDMVMAAGAYGQFISISKETGLIMVRQGDLGLFSLAPIAFHNDIWELINQLDQGPNSTSEITPSSLSVFPNPARERIFVDGLAAGGATLRLYNLEGRLLGVQQDASSYPLDQLAAGVYILEVEVDGTVQRFRIRH